MKLLILLITLLTGTNPSSSMPVQSTTMGYDGGIFMEDILEQLEFLVKNFHSLKQKITDITKLESIQTPQNIMNACACGKQFKEHLKKSVQLVVSSWDSDHFHNILDNLKGLTFKTPQTDNCHFKNHNITNFSNIKTFLLEHNIHFIQQWNTNNCH